MLRIAKLGLAVLMVLSIAGVLFTPDPGDDMDGLLQEPFLPRSMLTLISRVPQPEMRFPAFSFEPILPLLGWTSLLDLVCTRLC